MLIPLAAALLGVRADERTFFLAAGVGIATCFAWNFLLKQPLGIDGAALGTFANFIVFRARLRLAKKHLTR